MPGPVKPKPTISPRKCEAQADYLAEEILEIADDGKNDWVERQDGSAAVNNEAVQRSRLRVDARKWLMSKLMPKKYGEKLELGGDLKVTLGLAERLEAAAKRHDASGR